MGATLKHSHQPNGKGATATESLSQPDDIVTLGSNLDSTLVEFTPSGSVEKQWDVTGGAKTATVAPFFADNATATG